MNILHHNKQTRYCNEGGNIMGKVIEKSNGLVLRYTEEKDLDYIINAEKEPENLPYVGQWTREQHLRALSDEDVLHIVLEDNQNTKIGYAIIAGIQNPNKSIELKRIVVTKKGEGFGRIFLRLIKRLLFNQLNAHRLWLDVRDYNIRAKSLYKAEGFIEEGLIRECIYYNEKYISLIVMSILEEEFQKKTLGDY